MLEQKDIELLSGLLDQKLDAVTDRLDSKIDLQYHDIMAFLETGIEPKLQLLAEGHTSIIKKMTPPQEIDDIKADISFLKDAIKYLSAKVQVLESKVS